MKLIYILFILSNGGISLCAAQEKSSDFQLLINIQPSFHNESTFIINETNQANSIDLIVYNGNKKRVQFKEKAILSEDNIKQVLDFINAYKFRIKSSEDTVGTEKIFMKGDSVVSYIITMGLDGVNVNGFFMQSTIKKSFAFWSPKKGTENYILIKHLFSISKHSFRKNKAISYIQKLESYFDD